MQHRFDTTEMMGVRFAVRASNPFKAATMTVTHGFFVPVRDSFLRVLAEIQQGLGLNTASRSFSDSKHPIRSRVLLRKNREVQR